MELSWWDACYRVGCQSKCRPEVPLPGATVLPPGMEESCRAHVFYQTLAMFDGTSLVYKYVLSHWNLPLTSETINIKCA